MLNGDPFTSQDFENTLDAWMAEFHTLLTFEASLPQGSDPDKENELDAVKAAVAANANLFMCVVLRSLQAHPHSRHLHRQTAACPDV